MHTSKWPHQNQARSDSRKSRKGMSDLGNHHGKKRAAGSAASEHKPLGEKAKSARRHVLNNTDNIQEGAWDDDNDSSFDLGVEQYGESPPHRPPSRVHSRANSVMSSPATSVVAASPPPESSGNQTENLLPGTPDADESDKDESGAAVSTPHSFLSSSTSTSSTIRPCTKSSECADTSTRISAGNANGTTTPRQISTSSVKDLDYSSQVSVSYVGGRSTSAQILMELTRVVLPPDRDNKYRIRVTVSADKPPVHTIWMENLSSHEQRKYSFTDVCDLPGADKSARVPTSAVLTALFRCISSQPDAIVIVGTEPRATAESKNIFEKGEVLLKTSTAERNSGDANGDDGDTLTLMVAYPALDLFRIDHNFPMKLVLANQQMQHLVKEVECLRGQLLLVQNDRDRLCEQLRQQEEENERIISRQVEVEVKARMADQQQQQSEEDIKQRVAGLVKKQIQTLMQTQEREKRDRDRARRWLFARSDWMTAFKPCRALTATITSDTQTSLLRPATAANARKYVVEWKEVIEIAEPLFQPTTSEGELTQSITVVKDGIYQVNANVSHDSLVQLRLVITSADSEDTVGTTGPGAAKSREILPTKVQLYDNKRRVSRVDTMLYLRASDQLSLELQLLNATTSTA